MCFGFGGCFVLSVFYLGCFALVVNVMGCLVCRCSASCLVWVGYVWLWWVISGLDWCVGLFCWCLLRVLVVCCLLIVLFFLLGMI